MMNNERHGRSSALAPEKINSIRGGGAAICDQASLYSRGDFASLLAICHRSVVSGGMNTGKAQAQVALVTALRSVSEGDEAALRQVFDQTSAKLMGICFRILKDHEEAEDALQDVYLSVWKRAGSFDPERASPISWLASIARNRAIDYLRSRRSHGTAVSDEEILTVADERPDALAVAVAQNDSERVHYCLSTLEEQARDVIRTAFFEGLSYSALAARSGVPLGTMKSWIRRGLLRLRTCLQA